MPDYASILRRSISALPDATPEMREAVYQRARAALARQLTAVDPPLSTREIETQHQELEQAVTRLEAEYAPGSSDEPAEFEAEAEEQIYYAAPERGDAASGDRPSRSASDDRNSADDDADEADEGDFEEEEEDRASRLPLFIAVGAVVVLVAALAAYGYAKRDAIAGLFGGGDDNVEVVSTTPAPIVMPAESEQPDDDPDKQDDRLANGSEPPPPESPLVEPAPLPLETAEVAPVEPLPMEPLPVETVPLEEERTAALPSADQGLVAQRAIYYFQGTEGAPGRAVEGSVTWSEIMRDNAPAVQATLHLAEPEVTTMVTIYRNNDVSLPASHMVEVEFQGALGSTAIQRVPALVLKSTEQARGEPLAGAAVPVTDQLFWIALSNDSDEATRNVTLLREGAWFDIPILFTDGTRALLTFEKGVPGDRIFETVMASWTPT